MDSSAAFLDLVFSESLREHTIKNARESLIPKPYQLFDLLLREERFTNFFSRIELYGNNLANLLGQFPRFEQHDFSTILLDEIIRSFTLSLLSERFNDMKSRTAVARIVLSVIKLSDPATLVHFGVKLGALPEILRILFSEGHIKQLTLTHNKHLEMLVSGPHTMEQWAGVAMDLCKQCDIHRPGTKRNSRVELPRFIRTVPCEHCTLDTSFDDGLKQDLERGSEGLREYSMRSTIELNVFKNLLGEPLGRWKIILSQQAMEDLEEVNDQGSLEDVRRRFSELASGDWGGKNKTPHLAKWRNQLSHRIPIFKSFYATGYFILWQIDISLDEMFGNYYQVIKVWTIGKPKNLDRIGLQIHRVQESYTKAQVEACSRDDIDGSRETRHPARVYLEGEKNGGMGVDEIEDEGFDDLAQLAKFYCLTETVLDNIVSTNRKVAFPLDISREEATVVNHFQTPAFILGRSGTGKTICLVYKLVGRYLSSKENGEPLKQVLLTKSEILAGKLRDNTDGLIEARVGKRQRHYGVGVDGDENTRKQYLSLTDEDFPLVCTFDYLLKLMENSIREQESRGRYIRINNSKCARVIDFMKFNLEYWESMPPRLKRGIPADLVFLEIMGVIKGFIFAATDFEPLSREDYLGVRWRMAPYFATERERAGVYDVYEWYERAKKERGDIDQADRIIKVMRALEAFRSSEILEDKIFEGNIRRMLDEIYVDEVQDQRTSEIGMLLTLVEFPWGIHFAGDTAQCISRDALFRFANAKSLFYERFRDSAKSTRDLKPTLLPLSHNYRAHKRILRVASLVMDLLYGGFPELVDELPPEIGHLPGPKPTLYIGKNIIDLLKLERKRETPLILEASNKFNEYGEVRVILVRDEETRDKLRSELGQSSLVLTILQSKGMEFEDVFLYDFFSTSPYSYKLNILEELLKRRHQPDFSLKDPESHADWAKRNIVLCSELKHLYVGVTRARNRLCLLESDTCILKPVQRLFNQTAAQLLPCRYPSEILEILSDDIGVCSEPSLDYLL
ncbi:P-loop containing nucleoside triphosphate hydrolase protein [Choiromyces venosus 120613-1]|uniref:P-loop containing nucleoside triphosphate hydrolase protein n=1 Tax=Choiromyces venosus 120613-1 TaxID=1336337 RepID=A0A3N4JTG9_9PEZI|nr:P-loop containing nucleoside triphosphate hydrolase protein [Choiromyces venosus 120613-1]